MGVISAGHYWTERMLGIAFAWMNLQWNKPSRTDYYLMRVAQRVHQWWKSDAQIEDEKLPQFEVKVVKEKTKEEVMKDRVARSKATWLGGLRRFSAQSKRGKRGN